MSDNRPIGIFDSGIGGLTVARAIQKILPNEQLIYFGDTAHMPYGDKSPDAIKYFSIKIGQFLVEANCKAIVIACNTASSLGYKDLREMINPAIPIINVIDPIVQDVSKQNHIHRVGVIGTKGTIKSDVYAQKLKEVRPDLEVASLATPLLAPMVEEGYFNNSISKTVINSYLEKAKLKRIDSLILACTHYPLIKPEIELYYKKPIYIIDSAEIVANYTKSILKKHQILNAGERGKHHFYVSDLTQSFQQSTSIFFQEKIHLELRNIWT